MLLWLLQNQQQIKKKKKEEDVTNVSIYSNSLDWKF